MCAIRTRVDVYALPTVMAMNVASVRSTPGAMCSNGDVPTASVTLPAQSGRLAIASLDSATARKALRADSATSVPSGTMDIPTVDGVTVMNGARLQDLMEVSTVMIMDNATVNRWHLVGFATSVSRPHSDWWRVIQMAVRDVSALDDRKIVSRVSFRGDRFDCKVRET